MKIRSIVFSLAAAVFFAAAASVPPAARAQQGAQPAPRQAVKQPPEIVEFQNIEDQWSTALVKQDQYTLETLLSPTFIDISSAGEITTRNQRVAAMFEKVCRRRRPWNSEW